eukprot:COSAG02_NODE_1079_length_14711_cov_86.326512_5_plen_191_part_00
MAALASAAIIRIHRRPCTRSAASQYATGRFPSALDAQSVALLPVDRALSLSSRSPLPNPPHPSLSSSPSLTRHSVGSSNDSSVHRRRVSGRFAGFAHPCPGAPRSRADAPAGAARGYIYLCVCVRYTASRLPMRRRRRGAVVAQARGGAPVRTIPRARACNRVCVATVVDAAMRAPAAVVGGHQHHIICL